ncbi:condensation domain-containing protein, partial [Streptomyces katsurahamanus]
TGRLDIPALRQAVIDVITRHTPLRTLVRHGDGQPYQHRLPPPDAASALSLVHTTPGALAARVARFCDRAFDPGADRPLRTALFRLNPAEHVLVLAAHPLAADHGSLGPLLRDLSEAYSARRTGARPDWAPLQQDYTGHTLGERARDGQCAGPGARAARTPSTGRRRDAEPIAFRLSPRLGREIAALARESGATVLMVLQTAVAATLSTLGAGAVVPVDVYVPGRPDASLDLLVGRFAHTLTLRADVSGDPSFRGLLARVRAVNLAAYDRRDLPHACPAAPSGAPFLPVTLSLDDGERARPELPGLAVRALPTRRRDIRCALAISFTAEPAEAAGSAGSAGAAGAAGAPVPAEAPLPAGSARYGAGGMTALIEYRPELFDEPAASRLAHGLVRLLERSLSAPDRPLSLLALPAPEPP